MNKPDQLNKNETHINESVINPVVVMVRNFDSIPFSHKLSTDQKSSFSKEMSSFLQKKRKVFTHCKLSDLSKAELFKLQSKGFLPAEIKNRSINISYNDDTIVLYNYDDHLTIISCGKSHLAAYKKVCEVEKVFEGFSEYLASSRYGYISPDLKKCGLGISLSVLVHLAVVPKIELFNTLKETIFTRGFNIDEYDLFPEKSDFYTISSRFNYGVTEEELISKFIAGINDILAMEKQLIVDYYYDNQDIDDEIYRSIGILKYARKMTRDELIKHLSNLKSGIKLHKDLPVTKKIINQIQSIIFCSDFSQTDDLQERASAVRTLMEEYNV